MDDNKIYYKRHLPHYQPEYATYFVTFRLAGSLPNDVIASLIEERDREEKLVNQIKDVKEKRAKLIDLRKRHFGKFDSLLDKNTTGPQWLKKPEVAATIAKAFHYRAGRLYDLLAYCIMPNHVHLVFSVGRFARLTDGQAESSKGRVGDSPYIVTDIIGSLKKYTALRANRFLQRKGAFWQNESYDHVVRDGKELERIIWYVLNNPVKAGLIEDWQKWKWSFIRDDILRDE